VGVPDGEGRYGGWWVGGMGMGWDGMRALVNKDGGDLGVFDSSCIELMQQMGWLVRK